MDPITIMAISELVKLGITGYISFMQQQGMTEEQIEAVFADAKKGLYARNPADIPSE